MVSNLGTFAFSLLTTLSGISPSELDSVRVIFYCGPTFNDSIIYDLNNVTAVLNNALFDPLKNTTLYFHGFSENQDYESIHAIVSAYNLRGTDNLLVLDWAQLVDGNFVQAIRNYKRLGPVLADKLIELFNAGLELETFHIVGHSLGGQLGGYVGREIIQKTGGKIKLPRITALDPAFPGFYFLGVLRTLSDKDGIFVQNLHTDAWSYGSPVEGGHVNLWANGGTAVQPGCPPRDYVLLSDRDLCSHWCSWRFFAEAIAGQSKKFYAIKATSWLNFKLGILSTPESVIAFGSHTPTDSRGNYYFTTNTASPFSRGMEGTKSE